MVKAIVGANWGDEGKGKITDMFAAKSDIVIRYQGGSNAGHTIINNYGRFALHLLPSGVFHSNIMNIIGNGVALNVPYLVKEIEQLTAAGVPMPKLMISDKAQLLMPYHVLFDAYEEERLSSKSFGSTKSGIAPFYSDKYFKTGFMVNELYGDKQVIIDRVQSICDFKNTLLEHLYHKPLLVPDEILSQLAQYKELIRPYVGDVESYLRDALKSGKNILLEGQLGALRDPSLGIYPYVTSSHTTAAFAAVGAGIPPYEIKDILAVVKAYSSAVGAGGFTSEIFGDEAEELRKRGGDKGEYGATTGRPRRVGWFDCVATKYGCRAQSATEAAFTVIDVLGYLEKIPVCVAYEIEGRETDEFPAAGQLFKAKPVLKVFDGWKCDIRGITKYEDLPENCRKYIEFIETKIEVPITIISNGPDRESVIYR